MTQSETVLLHLKRHRTITSQQAWSRYQITRLADCIHKLRRKGKEVATEKIPHGRSHYAKYRLLG